MLKAVATAILAFATVSAGAAADDPSGAQAAERARQLLAEQLKIAPSDVNVMRTEPATWPSSAMGCGKPGSVALTVITHGYAVTLSAQGREHRVHVSGANAIVCDKGAGLYLRKDPGHSMSARGLDVMMERARQDLAQRLGVEPIKIRLLGFKPQRFKDSGLDCPNSGETINAGPIDGYVLSLQHEGRVYTYHTDQQSVRPCPAIEGQ